MLIRACAYLLLISVVPLWAQDADRIQPPSVEDDASGAATPSSSGSDHKMITPIPVGEVGLPLSVAAETERRNYIRGGVIFQTAYDTNSFTSSPNAPGVNTSIPTLVELPGVNYSILPLLDLEVTRSRTQMDLFYSPGFTIYQGHSELNHVEHDLAFNLHYRLSPHLSFSVRESFTKGGYFQTLPGENDVSSTVGMIQKPNDTIIAPVAEELRNFTSAEVTYQVGPDSMIGANGTLARLWYPNNLSLHMATPYPYGLFESAMQGGNGFYARRLSSRHYIGVNYGIQKLLEHPSIVDTQTQSIVLFYTLYLPPSISLSVFAGPQRSDTSSFAAPAPSRTRMLVPEVGASFGYQLRRMSLASSFVHMISDGSGLNSAVLWNSGSVSLRFLMTKRLRIGVGGEYATNATLNLPLVVGNSGHTVSGTVFLEQPLREHMRVHFGYTHVHQTYNIVAISSTPTQRRVEASISYQFERPLGR